MPFHPPVSQLSEGAESRPGRRRVAAVVGLTLLEVIRRQDLPEEILEAEDPSITMPRRLGLSEVIDRQIRMYREEVRRGGRMTDEEVEALIRLVLRRQDSRGVLFRVGRILAGENGGGTTRLTSLLPVAANFALARRAVSRRLRKLFGRRLGAFTESPFTLEARQHLLIHSDPGGDACHVVTGLAESLVQRHVGGGCRVAHDQCLGRNDPVCRWTVLQEEAVQDAEGVPDLLLNPEPGAG